MPYNDRAEELRGRLRASIDEQQARKRRFVESLDHSSMTALALSAAARRREEDEAAEAARLADLEDMRQQWTDSFLRRTAPVLTAFFAEQMGIPEDSPLLAELVWRFDPEKLASLSFRRNDEGRIVAEATDRERDAFALYADIDALTIMGKVIGKDSEGNATSVVFSAEHGYMNSGIGDLAALGRELERACEDLEKKSAQED